MKIQKYMHFMREEWGSDHPIIKIVKVVLVICAICGGCRIFNTYGPITIMESVWNPNHAINISVSIYTYAHILGVVASIILQCLTILKKNFAKKIEWELKLALNKTQII